MQKQSQEFLERINEPMFSAQPLRMKHVQFTNGSEVQRTKDKNQLILDVSACRGLVS